jgi:hypothetical protein
MNDKILNKIGISGFMKAISTLCDSIKNQEGFSLIGEVRLRSARCCLQHSRSSLCQEYRSRSKTDYPHSDASKYFRVLPANSVNNILNIQVLRSSRQVSIISTSGFLHHEA